MNAPELQTRRRCLLLTLWAADDSTAHVHALVRQMYLIHNLTLSNDQVRGDLSWLQEQGLVRFKADTAQLTERGGDVALKAAPWPGE